MVFAATGSETAAQMSSSWCLNGGGVSTSYGPWFEYPIKDNFANVGTRALGGVAGSDLWGLEESTNQVGDTQGIIPETKKLKAKWTP